MVTEIKKGVLYKCIEPLNTWPDAFTKDQIYKAIENNFLLFNGQSPNGFMVKGVMDFRRCFVEYHHIIYPDE